MPKPTVFDKVREELGLKGEYGQAVQAIFCNIAKGLPASALSHRPMLVSLVESGSFTAKQVEAALKYLKAHPEEPLDQAAFDKACGVGIVYSDAEIEEAIGKAAAATPGQNAFRCMGAVSRALPWLDGKDLKEKVEAYFASHAGELGAAAEAAGAAETAAKKAPAGASAAAGADPDAEPDLEALLLDAGFMMRPPDVAATLVQVPYDNRYTQLPEYAEQHRRFLEEQGAKVLTRFPPEPNGYLHLGHAKSLFINFGYAKIRGGKTYLRMDDTNPEKEEGEYIESIHECVKWLGYEPFKCTNTSDYFQRLYDIAVEMIARGQCYVDDQKPEQVAEYREKRLDPPCRSRPVEENARLFREMTMGLWPEGSLTLRMKIDMQADNPNLRDPIAYRVKFNAHPLTGDKWCVYPSYDFSHCLIDAFEHITHSICTLEFNVRRPSYDWLTHIVAGIKTSDGWECGYRPMQWEFNRLNVTYNVMSKRRLLRLVNEGRVSGWNDPRLLTLVGMRRRGYTPKIINKFVEVVGVSRGQQVIEFEVLEQVARIILDRQVGRAMVVLKPIRVKLVNWRNSKRPPNLDKAEYVLYPKDESRGKVSLPIGDEIYIDARDFREKADSTFYRLAPGRTCCLRYGPLIHCREVVREPNGEFSLICSCTFNKAVIEKAKAAAKKQKRPLTVIPWVSKRESHTAEVRVYERLFRSKNPYEVEGDWIDDLNPDSLKVYPNALVPGYVAKTAGFRETGYTHFQYERLGYFVTDEESTLEHPIFNRVVDMRIPDDFKPGAQPCGKCSEEQDEEWSEEWSDEAAGEPCVEGGK